MFFNIRENLHQLKHLRIYTGTSLEDKKAVPELMRKWASTMEVNFAN